MERDEEADDTDHAVMGLVAASAYAPVAVADEEESAWATMVSFFGAMRRIVVRDRGARDRSGASSTSLNPPRN
jgi:hypothetical protein